MKGTLFRKGIGCLALAWRRDGEERGSNCGVFSTTASCIWSALISVFWTLGNDKSGGIRLG
jgi:hypothetical protein